MDSATHHDGTSSIVEAQTMGHRARRLGLQETFRKRRGERAEAKG